MSHVFVSYKREDELRVGRIAQALEAEGLDVWWDRGLPGGESWHANIEAKLHDAGCLVVVWSIASTGTDGGYVREEARRGLSRHILVPVLIDKIGELPLGFGEIQAIDLIHWRGDPRHPDFQDLVATICAKLSHSPLPAATGPARRIARRLWWGGVSGLGLATAALLAFNTFGLAARLCTLPGAQPGLSDTCGAVGLGGRPKQVERTAWETRVPGSCPALREHIARFPAGAYRAEAADLITARKVSTHDAWQPVTRSLDLFQPAGAPAEDAASAQAQALKFAQDDSDRLCRGFGGGTLYRFVSSRPVADHWSCRKEGTRTVCGFEGHAQCELSLRQSIEAETCGSSSMTGPQ